MMAVFASLKINQAEGSLINMKRILMITFIRFCDSSGATRTANLNRIRKTPITYPVFNLIYMKDLCYEESFDCRVYADGFICRCR